MLKMLKISCFKLSLVLSKINLSQVCLKVFPRNFLHYVIERHVVATSFTHIHSVLQQKLFFLRFQWLENAPSA